MDPKLLPGNRPDINVDAHANLDIKLDDWQAVAGLGVLGITAIAITLIVKIIR